MKIIVAYLTRLNPIRFHQRRCMHVINKRCFVFQGRHAVMMLESTAIVTSPREDSHTVLIKDQPVAQVKYEILKTVLYSNSSGSGSLMLKEFPGGGGSRFYPETLNGYEDFHHRGQFSFRPDHPDSSHLVFMEGNEVISNTQHQLLMGILAFILFVFGVRY